MYTRYVPCPIAPLVKLRDFGTKDQMLVLFTIPFVAFTFLYQRDIVFLLSKFLVVVNSNTIHLPPLLYPPLPPPPILYIATLDSMGNIWF